MVEEDLFTIIDNVLKPLGAAVDPGIEFSAPPLDVLRFYYRPVRLHWVPFFGRAQSLVAVIRQPTDLAFTTEGCRGWLRRLAMAVNGRYPPGRGLSIGLTTIVLTSEPITPGDDSVLQTAFVELGRMRAVPLGLIRLNLGQEAIAFALTHTPDNLFPEPIALADHLTEHFKRFVSTIDP